MHTHLKTLQMNEINYKANMLQMKALNLTYSTVIIVKSEIKQEWAKSRTDEAELRRRSQEMKKSNGQCITIPFIHKNNQSDYILNGVWGPSTHLPPVHVHHSLCREVAARGLGNHPHGALALALTPVPSSGPRRGHLQARLALLAENN